MPFASCQCGCRKPAVRSRCPRPKPFQQGAAPVRLAGAHGRFDKVGCRPEQDSRVTAGSG